MVTATSDEGERMLKQGKRTIQRSTLALAVVSVTVLGVSAPAMADGPTPPNLIPLLEGYSDFWISTNANTLAGDVQGVAGINTTLQHNDELVQWINNNATTYAELGTASQQFNALQTAEYNNGGTAYDESLTVGTSLGSILGPIYIDGSQSGAIPLVTALLNDENGSAGAFVSTGAAKTHFSYPRPYLQTTAGTGQCVGTAVSSASLAANRVGMPWATDSDLNMIQVEDQTDSTHQFSENDVPLDAGYAGLCTSGSFPSGHTTNAYQSGITLATLLPELAPEILTRTSEQGNNRIVLGVHYPLDIMGGRMSGETAIATLWSNETFRTQTLEPARAQLVSYLQAQCGDTIANCYAQGSPYTSNPYGGAVMPGGSAQIVTDRASAMSVYKERLTYGFSPVGATDLPAAVPAGAENLLLTAFPSLTAVQRTSVIAQTQLASGYALDLSSAGNGSWQRVNLAAAMSATVQKYADGTVTVVSTGGAPTVLEAPHAIITGPSTIAPGDKGTFTFAGFDPNEAVSFSLTGENALGATFGMVRTAVETKTTTRVANASGVVTITVTLPSNARGTYTLTGTGQTSGVTGAFTFSVGLPATGVDAGSTTGLWVCGGLLALGGALAVAFATRRRKGLTARG
jgi:hypothetical protein